MLDKLNGSKEVFPPLLVHDIRFNKMDTFLLTIKNV